MRSRWWCPVLALAFAAPSAGGQAYLKVNAPATLVGVPGIGVEWDRAEKRTAQFDVTVSPWVSRDGAPAAFAMFVQEWRYHPKGAGHGPYYGLNVGATVFRFQKWTFVERTWYQEGFGALAGGVVGYQWTLADDWRLDLQLGGGTSQALYKGYDYATGERNDGERWWNRSGELLPYRLGLMVGRPLRGGR